MRLKHILVVGAGFSGAVIARELALAGHRITVVDSRSHVAGNCHTERCERTGVLVHKFGPHIFHTSNERVWNYVRQFSTFRPFINRVKAISGGQVYSLPINLHTINQFFGKTLKPTEARQFIASLSDQSITEPQSFEEQALKLVGREIYETFFKAYTEKQWGTSPQNLPASILKRLPIRFNYDDNYYSSTFQGIPEEGYTGLIENILKHPRIRVHLENQVTREDAHQFDHTFYSGPIDEWFQYSEGKLKYRTLEFQQEIHDGDFQGNAVVNYCDNSANWTRISEHKHFAPWESHEKTIIYKEFSREHRTGDTPYYPMHSLDDKARISRYLQIAGEERQVTFVGRLGTYRYLDMHLVVEEALDVAHRYLAKT